MKETGHVLRLAVGEWRKLRRRWIPWLILGIALVFTQVVLWVGYVVYHLDDEKEAGGELPYALPSSLEAIPDGFVFLVVPLLILSATVVGVEYGWGTLRATLTRGVGRWQLLSAKLLMLVCAGVGGIVVLGLGLALASFLSAIIPPGEEGTVVLTDGEAWVDALVGVGKVAWALVPYTALAVLLAVVSQSTAQGVALSMGYYILELVIAPALGGVSSWMQEASELVLLGHNATDWLAVGERAASGGDMVKAAGVMVAYAVVFVGAGLWVFQRRDVVGAKGE